MLKLQADARDMHKSHLFWVFSCPPLSLPCWPTTSVYSANRVQIQEQQLQPRGKRHALPPTRGRAAAKNLKPEPINQMHYVLLLLRVPPYYVSVCVCVPWNHKRIIHQKLAISTFFFIEFLHLPSDRRTWTWTDPDRSRNYISYRGAICCRAEPTFSFTVGTSRTVCEWIFYISYICVYLTYNWKLSQVICHCICGQTWHTNAVRNCRVHLIAVLRLLMPQLFAVQWSHSKCPRGFHNIFNKLNKLCSRCVTTDLRIAEQNPALATAVENVNRKWMSTAIRKLSMI